jgi:hypothetical protein
VEDIKLLIESGRGSRAGGVGRIACFHLRVSVCVINTAVWRLTAPLSS